MIRKYIFKKHVRDCFICAIKPLIYAGFTITYIGKPKCPHITNTDRPRIVQNIGNSFLARIFNLFIVVDVVYVTFKLANSEFLSVPSKYYYTIILPNYVNTLNYTICFLRSNTSYIKYTNELITLIDKRKFFGIDSVLNERFTKILQLWSLLYCCFIFVVCLLFVYTITPKELTLEAVLLATSMLVNNLNALAFGVYIMTTLMIYKVLFQSCFDGIYKTITKETQKQGLVTVSLQRTLQYQQQFYIAACSIYKGHVFAFGNIVFYAGQLVFTLLSIVQGYFSAFEETDEEGYWFVAFSRFYHIFLTLISAAICIQSNSIQFLSQDLISFLYKYKITKLNTAEASQVEMLLITLNTEKPVLTASNLYTLGINLLASASGTAVTYVLVALQFHASFTAS